MMEELRTYTIRFMVDKLHTEATVKAYSRPDAITLLKKQYSNCRIVVEEPGDKEKT